MSSSLLIGNWASGVWSTLGSPSNVSALAISGYATQPSTLGRLNSLITTCFSGSGFSGAGTFNYDVVPDVGQEELAIVEQMYYVSYWSNLAQSTMGQGGDGAGGLPFVTLNEGDTKLGRANPAAIGTVYMNRSKQATLDLNYLVNAYINNSQGGNTPRSVNYLNPGLPNWAGETVNTANWGL